MPAGVDLNVSTMAEASEKGLLTVPRVGDVLEGTIISKSKTEMHLDIGGVLTGVVRGPELFDGLMTYDRIDIGDKVTVSVLDVENEMGVIECSLRKAGRKEAWTEILQAKERGDVLQIYIFEANKGGLLSELHGVQGFLPVSQLSGDHYPKVDDGDKVKILEKLQSYVGQTFSVKVLDADAREEKLIFSEKEARAEEKREIIDQFKVGDVVKGRVSGVVDFGAFVQFEGLEGLVHISELSWQRVDNPRDFAKEGDEVEVEIIAIEGTRISLSIKKLQKDPWLEAVKRYSVGEVVKGKVSKITPFGAFVQLDDDIHGLVHISELSKDTVEDPSAIVSIGDEKEFRIISIEAKDHRLGLSLKAMNA